MILLGRTGHLCHWISREQRATVSLLTSRAARQESPGSDAGQGKLVEKFEMHVVRDLKLLNTLCFGNIISTTSTFLLWFWKGSRLGSKCFDSGWGWEDYGCVAGYRVPSDIHKAW